MSKGRHITCIQCKETFKTKSQLLSHSHKHQKGRQQFGSIFSIWQKLLVSERQKKSPANMLNRKREALPFRNKCGWCGQSFTQRTELLQHRQLVHHKPKDETVIKKRRIPYDWNCKEKSCGVPFKTKEALKLHMSSAHPNVVFACPLCRFKTQLDYFLKRYTNIFCLSFTDFCFWILGWFYVHPTVYRFKAVGF